MAKGIRNNTGNASKGNWHLFGVAGGKVKVNAKPAGTKAPKGKSQ